MNPLPQQQMMQLQQQRKQSQHQLDEQNLSVRPPQLKASAYRPGKCARRLSRYMYQQRCRPEGNNIDFWRKFTAEYFAPNARKRWCFSLYGSGRQTAGVFPQGVWNCEICNHKLCHGFEATFEVLPRLYQIKFASGLLEEFLYIDKPSESQNASGQIVLDYDKAIQECAFEQSRAILEGQLRIVFSPDLKICSWEFCSRRHEELVPRRLLVPQVAQLGPLVRKCQAAAQNTTSSLSAQDLQTTCNLIVASACQLTKALETPLFNDLGYPKRYVRCLQISEVVNCMKDLIDYSKQTGIGAIDSLINFPRKTSASGLHGQQAQQIQGQTYMAQILHDSDQNCAQPTSMQLSSARNGALNVSPLNARASSSTWTASIVGVPQNPMNPRLENQMNTVANSYGGGDTSHIPSGSYATLLLPSQLNLSSSTFSSLTPSMLNNNNPAPTYHDCTHFSKNSPANSMLRSTAETHDTVQDDMRCSMQRTLLEMMISSKLNGISTIGNGMQVINGITDGITSSVNGVNCFGNGMGNSPGVSSIGLGIQDIPQDPMGLSHHQQQHMGNRLLNELGFVSSFNNLEFDGSQNSDGRMGKASRS